jgi:hypothetical protein
VAIGWSNNAYCCDVAVIFEHFRSNEEPLIVGGILDRSLVHLCLLAQVSDPQESLFPKRVAEDFVIGPEAIAISECFGECRYDNGHVSVIAPPLVGLWFEARELLGD